MRKDVMLTCLFIVFIVHNAFAEDFRASTAHWSPYAMKTEKGISGISVEILKEIVKRTGDTVSIKLYPTKRLNNLFNRNELDINFADSPDWNEIKENPDFLFTKKYMDVKEYIYFLQPYY